MRISLGIGLLVCILVTIALFLFGAVNDPQAAALFLFLGGLWTAIFGAFLGSRNDRLYDLGFGIVIMVFSTFIFLPLQYTAGLVVVALAAMVVASIVARPKSTPGSAPKKTA